MTKYLIQRKRKNIYENSRRSRAPQGCRLGDDRLEVLVLLVALGELLHIARNLAAVEEASVSTQLVLNKYNTNYEALKLVGSTALAFNSWQNFITATYYKLMKLP